MGATCNQSVFAGVSAVSRCNTGCNKVQHATDASQSEDEGAGQGDLTVTPLQPLILLATLGFASVTCNVTKSTSSVTEMEKVERRAAKEELRRRGRARGRG